MSVNLNHPRSKSILFIETSLLFNRFDIIDRVIDTCSYLVKNWRIGVIYYFKRYNSYRLVILSKTCSPEYITGKLNELINTFLEKCSFTILLDEKGFYRPQLVEEADCFISGLHTDIPITLKERLKKPLIKLSNISYLASQLLYIIDQYPYIKP